MEDLLIFLLRTFSILFTIVMTGSIWANWNEIKEDFSFIDDLDLEKSTIWLTIYFTSIYAWLI